jgi:hypothetical protein
MEFLAFTSLLLILYFGAVQAIIKHLPGLRNTAAFFVALISAYLFSIAFDNLWGPLLEGLSLSILPIIAGTVYGIAFYSRARRLTTTPGAARIAYVLIGALAIFAGCIGHKHNLFVGASLLLLGLFIPFDLSEQSGSLAGD